MTTISGPVALDEVVDVDAVDVCDGHGLPPAARATGSTDGIDGVDARGGDVARGEVRGSERGDGRTLAGADVDGERAAGVEVAAGGGSMGLGPRRAARSRGRRRAGSGYGMAAISAPVYGWRGSREQVRHGLASSTSRPRYITSARSQMCSTTARLWVMSRIAMPSSLLQPGSRLRIWACTRRRAPDVGSSATISRGLQGERGRDAAPLALAAR